MVYADIDSIRPRVQVFVSNLTDSSKWKLCADASVLNAHKAAVRLKNSYIQLYASAWKTTFHAFNNGLFLSPIKAYLKWGRNCQDYKISTELVTGRFAAHPAAQVKLEWPKVPSSVRSIAEW